MRGGRGQGGWEGVGRGQSGVGGGREGWEGAERAGRGQGGLGGDRVGWEGTERGSRDCIISHHAPYRSIVCRGHYTSGLGLGDVRQTVARHKCLFL